MKCSLFFSLCTTTMLFSSESQMKSTKFVHYWLRQEGVFHTSNMSKEIKHLFHWNRVFFAFPSLWNLLDHEWSQHNNFAFDKLVWAHKNLCSPNLNLYINVCMKWFSLSYWKQLLISYSILFSPFRTQLKLECLEDACVLEGTNDTLEDKHGCPAYVSPELLHCAGGYSGKLADIWSLGVMFYTMLVGRYPFQDMEPTVLFSKIRRGHFIIPDSLSSKAKCLIRSMMRQEPLQRLNGEEILEHPWFKSTFNSVTSYRVDKRAPDQTVPSVNIEESYFLPVKNRLSV